MSQVGELLAQLTLSALVLFLISWSLKILGSELRHFMDALRSEIREASKAKKTVASLNWFQFITVAVVGVLVIVASTGQKILGIAFENILGETKASELASYSDYSLLFFVLALLMVVSLICVVIDNHGRDRD
jgi:hypothetical protein